MNSVICVLRLLTKGLVANEHPANSMPERGEKLGTQSKKKPKPANVDGNVKRHSL